MTPYRVFFACLLIGLFFTGSLEGQINTVRYAVNSIEFEGNSLISSRRLRKVIKLQEPDLLSSAEFNQRSLKLDALKVRNFYQSQGYLAASVEESFEISPDNKVNILFTVNEGTRSFLRHVTVEGNEALSEERISRVLRLRIGRPFNPIGLRQGIPDLEREYGKLGKLYFTIDPSYVPGRDVDLRLTIYEGPPVRIDNFIIKGLEKMDSTFVMREFELKSGDIFNQELVELSERRIFETGLFSMVDMIPAKSTKGPEWVNVVAEVREFNMKELLWEPGISRIRSASEGGEPISGVEGSMQWLDRSFLGSGTRFGMKASVQLPLEALQNPFGVAIFRSDLRLTSQWLRYWRAPNTLRLFAERVPELLLADKPLLRYGLEWQGMHRFAEESILSGGLRWSEIVTEDLAKRQSQQERSVSIIYRFRRLDNLIAPTQGGTFSIESSVVGWILGGTQDYYRLELDMRRFIHLGSSRVLALRTKVGRMERLSPEAKEIPSYDIFYLGGSTSLRGWKSQRFHTYTVIDENGKEVERGEGGLVKILLNAEVRIPLWSIFGVDLFLDGGILAADLQDLSAYFKEWAKGEGWDYGVEFTITTPLGPIRIYYAIPLKSPAAAIPNLGVPYAF